LLVLTNDLLRYSKERSTSMHS